VLESRLRYAVTETLGNWNGPWLARLTVSTKVSGQEWMGVVTGA
jgi:hypothetical protein